MAHATQVTSRKEVLGHPAGLFILFFTEMWERFSYYGMRAILVLYMISSATGDNPGLGWDEGDAIALYGWYTMLVYVMSIPGGILADKFIGQKKAVLVGGLILVAGHGILAFEAVWAFYTGLALIILGVGGLKPNISTMVGGLYKEGDIRRDKGFTIFYIGINIGAAAAAIAVGIVAKVYGWHYGFGMAGIGMLLGQIVFMAGQKYLVGVGEAPDKAEAAKSDDSFGRLFNKLFKEVVPLTVTMLIIAFGVYLIAADFMEWPMASLGYGLLSIFLAFVVGLMMVIYNELNEIEKDRYVVLLISFVIVIVFWGAFEQAGGLMNIYTAKKVDKFVSTEIMDWITYGGAALMLIYGLISRGFHYRNLRFHLYGSLILTGVYTLLRSLYLEFGEEYEIPAPVFQAINAIFIIIFGTIVANFWAWRKVRGGEASSLYKMAIGTIVMGLGFLFMAKASMEVLGTGEAALVWIIMAYLFHTLGELSASPVALSFITKVAPAKYVSIMMGVYFAATGLGNKVAGAIGEASQSEPVYAEVERNFEGVTGIVPDSVLSQAGNFEIKGLVYLESDQLVFESEDAEAEIENFIAIDDQNKAALREELIEANATPQNPQHVTITYENPKDYKALDDGQVIEVDLGNYRGQVVLFEASNKRELWTFIYITIFTAAFGFLLIVFLKKLKKLTHGVEDAERDMSKEEEPQTL